MDSNAFSEDNLENIFNKKNKEVDENKLNATIDAGTTFDVSAAKEEYK
jgi:hypothetical protein